MPHRLKERARCSWQLKSRCVWWNALFGYPCNFQSATNRAKCKIKVALRACRNYLPVWNIHSHTAKAEMSRWKILPGHVPASTTLYFPCSAFPNILSVSLVNRRQAHIKIQSWGECSQCWLMWAFHGALQLIHSRTGIWNVGTHQMAQPRSGHARLLSSVPV